MNVTNAIWTAPKYATTAVNVLNIPTVTQKLRLIKSLPIKINKLVFQNFFAFCKEVLFVYNAKKVNHNIVM